MTGKTLFFIKKEKWHSNGQFCPDNGRKWGILLLTDKNDQKTEHETGASKLGGQT
jgi:hypothetical protein